MTKVPLDSPYAPKEVKGRIRFGGEKLKIIHGQGLEFLCELSNDNDDAGFRKKLSDAIESSTVPYIFIFRKYHGLNNPKVYQIYVKRKTQ